jgi:hypothetical protein
MPTVKLPLVGSFNERGLAGNAALVLNQDQRFLNTEFEVVTNAVTGKSTLYAKKRPGWGTDSLVAAGSASTAVIKPLAFNATLSAFGDTNSTIYFGTTSVGTITGRALHMSETLISSVSYVVIKSSDGTGWYYVDGAKDDLTYVGDTHNGTAVIDSLDSTTGIYVGQAWSGTGVAAGARVLTVDSATQITLNANCSADGTDITFTKTPVAKILDSDFITTGVNISAFVPMDGYLFYTTDDGNLRNSDLNSVVNYTSTSSIPVQMSPDQPVGVAVQNNAVVAFGHGSKEVFQNVGMASGSPLQRVASAFQRVGCLDQRSMTQIEDDIYFVSTPYEGDIGVYLMRNLNAVKISPPAIDRIIGTVSGSGAIYASSFKLGGQTYAAFVLSTAADSTSILLLESGDTILLESGDDILLEDSPASTASYIRTLVYNAGLKVWSEWDCDEATFIDGVSNGTANQLVATSRMKTDGKVYTINPVSDGQLYEDDGAAFTMEVRTAKIDFGTNRRKFFDSIELLGCDMSSGAQPYISWSDDDYETWSTPRAFDMTGNHPRITRCGSTQGQRAFKITESTDAAFRAEALAISYKEGVV